MTIVRIANGKIVEAWNNFDFMTMYKQCGQL
jgi:predicted ester cyclase